MPLEEDGIPSPVAALHDGSGDGVELRLVGVGEIRGLAEDLLNRCQISATDAMKWKTI
jgi:hypothetical protein